MGKNRSLYDDDDMDDDYGDDFIDCKVKGKVSSSKGTVKPSAKTTVSKKVQQKNIIPIPSKSVGVVGKDVSKDASISLGLSTSSENVIKVDENLQLKSLQITDNSSASAENMLLSSPAVGHRFDKMSDDGGDIIVSNELPRVTIVVAGHVDAGKSTLIGNLLFKTGNVSQKLMHQFEKESTAIGKSSFRFAWVMDETKSERQRGVTIDIAEKMLRLPDRVITLFDAPGHRDFVGNMIKGASLADAALLVVPASEGDFESSMAENSQTREHALLLHALGIRELVVAVNKMDQVGPVPWSQSRFCFVENELRAFLQQEVGFEAHQLQFVPVSGLLAENLVSVSSGCHLRDWYPEGPTLLQAMLRLEPASRLPAVRALVVSAAEGDLSEPQRLSVRVLQGTVRCGRRYAYYSPSRSSSEGCEECLVVGRVGRLWTTKEGSQEEPCEQLLPGQSGTLLLSVVSTSSSNSSSAVGACAGAVLFKGPSSRPHCCRLFEATLHTAKQLPLPLIPGLQCELLLCGAEFQCHIAQIHCLLPDRPYDGTTVFKVPTMKSKKPKCIPAGKSALVSIAIDGGASVVIDSLSVCPALARFALRSRGTTYAVGTCELSRK